MPNSSMMYCGEFPENIPVFLVNAIRPGADDQSDDLRKFQCLVIDLLQFFQGA